MALRYPVYQPSLDGNEKAYVNQCLDTTWISSKGEFINRFEKGFAEFTGAAYATSVHNGTVAIHLALEALGIGKGDEVIVPTLTYVASVNTIVQAGAVPVFAESEPTYWQLDPADIEKRITPKTKAVMVVHLYGQACDMDAIMAICQKHKLLLVEDCAEAFGTLYKGRHVGTFGDAGTFSFFGNKTITTGEGGMVTFKDEAAYKRAAHLKNQGVSATRQYWHDIVAYNYRMTNIQAAIGCAQLERAEATIAKKRELAEWYREGLKGLPVSVHAEAPGTRHSYWMCSIMVNDAEDRDPLREHLAAQGVETRPLFYPSHIFPMFEGLTQEGFPVATSLGARGVNLPSYPALAKADVAEICAQVAGYFQRAEAGLRRQG
ncbi:aminotransferase class V-fold PLP-dependent enzyme [bacterium]|nr:aminotransferase class V-fold PLP-dependent enzyme [bacterium]